MTPAEAVSHALTALAFAELAVQDYTHYPTPEYRRQRLDELAEAKRVLRGLA